MEMEIMKRGRKEDTEFYREGKEIRHEDLYRMK